MRRPFVAACAAGMTALAAAAPPPRNLLVALREVVDDRAGVAQTAEGGATWSTQRQGAPALAPQQVQVANGARASLRLSRSVPVTWVQAAAVRSAASGPGAGTAAGAGVVNGLTWLASGQALSVTPTWPGGARPVRLEVAVSAATLDAAPGAAPGADMPAQADAGVMTTVSAPLGRWVTIAASGGIAPAEVPGTVSTLSATAEPRRLIQLRVIEAP